MLDVPNYVTHCAPSLYARLRFNNDTEK
jgi:hypothetical protein